MSTRKHQGKNRILDLPLGMRCIGLGHPGQGSTIRRRRWGFHVTLGVEMKMLVSVLTLHSMYTVLKQY